MKGTTPNARWGRSLTVSLVLAVVSSGAAYAWHLGQQPAQTDRDYTIAMTDYAFTPDHMVWRVGDRVKITLLDKSEANPPKQHEFMVGRVPNTTKTIFGIQQDDGFETPFFKDVAINIDSGSDLQMLMGGDAKLTGLSPKQVMQPGLTGPMEATTGFMPVLGTRKAHLTFSFVVPDKPGKWTYGCFQQSGEHYLNGMKGTITIRPKSA